MLAFLIVTLLQGDDSCLQPCWEWHGKRRLCKVFLFWWPTAIYLGHSLQEALDPVSWSQPALCHYVLLSDLNR